MQQPKMSRWCCLHDVPTHVSALRAPLDGERAHAYKFVTSGAVLVYRSLLRARNVHRDSFNAGMHLPAFDAL